MLRSSPHDADTAGLQLGEGPKLAPLLYGFNFTPSGRSFMLKLTHNHAAMTVQIPRPVISRAPMELQPFLTSGYAVMVLDNMSPQSSPYRPSQPQGDQHEHDERTTDV